MRTIVLDGYTLNPGDLSWDGLRRFGECEVYDRTPPEQVVERSQGAEILFTNKVVLDRPVMDSLPDLKYIGVTATGYNVVDLDAAREKGIIVTNVPAYGTPAVAQMVFALLLELCQRVAHHDQTVKQGRWAECEDFCYWDFPLVELAGQTMGIVGLGRIGRAVAQRARAFEMRVLGHDVEPAAFADTGVESADLDTIFTESDVVSLHCNLTEDNEGLIDAERLGQMKNTAFLINTSRGPLVRDQDLADALNAGHLAGAALDVLSVEPPSPDNPLLTAKNCIITPHIAWATRAARARLMGTAIGNVDAFLSGSPRNVIT